jgi:hypothetical protein
VKHRRYTHRRTYTDRELATIFQAYQLLGAILIGPDGTNVRILDNLADMQYGKRPRWGGKALRKATWRNMAVLVPVIDEKWPRKPKDGKE